jgi:hypothetical protein
MRWNLRLAAANRGIWKASELQRMLAERGMVRHSGVTQVPALASPPDGGVTVSAACRLDECVDEVACAQSGGEETEGLAQRGVGHVGLQECAEIAADEATQSAGDSQSHDDPVVH